METCCFSIWVELRLYPSVRFLFFSGGLSTISRGWLLVEPALIFAWGGGFDTTKSYK
jgi:hypothetical protein